MATGDTKEAINSLKKFVDKTHEAGDRKGLMLVTRLEGGDLDGLPASTRYAFIKVAQYAQRILDGSLSSH